MNKEEMLELLEKLREKVSESKVEDYDIDGKVAVIEEVIRLRNQKEAEIKYLTERLSNDENYIDKTPYLYDESRRFNLEDYLEGCIKQENDNIANIEYYEDLIAQMERTLPAQEELFNNLLKNLDNEIEEMQADLRDSANMTDEEFNSLRDQIAAKRALREEHLADLENGRTSLENAKKNLETLKANSESLTNARIEAEQAIERFDKTIEERPIIDVEAKKADERQLLISKAELNAYYAREAYASFDYERDLNEIIRLYKADSITTEEVVERVKEFKGFVADEFLTEDISKRLEDPELEEIRKAKIACSDEIARLETKLADENNYAVSVFAVERRTRELKRLNGRINNIEQQIEAYNKEMTAIQIDIETSEEFISQLQFEKQELEKQIRRAGANIDPDYEKQLLDEISSKEQDIEYLQSVKIDCSRTLEHDATELELLESKNERYKTIYSRLENNYEGRNKINAAAKRMDEQQLAKLKAGMNALNRREAYISTSLEEELENIISANLAKPAEPTVAPVAAPTVKDSMDAEDLEAILRGMEDFSKVKKPQDDLEEIEEIEEPVIPVPSKGKKDGEKIADDDIDYDEDLDPLNLGDTRGFRAKFSERENEKLAKKAKKVGFVQKLKRWFKKILLVASLVLVITGLKKCSQSSIDDYMNKVQNDPTRIEDMTEEEIKDDIEEELGIKEELTENPTLSETEAEEELETINDLKSVDEVAKEVIKGIWGNGQEREDRLREAGYNPQEIQDRVSVLLKNSPAKTEVKPEEKTNVDNTGVKPAEGTVTENPTGSTGDISMEEQERILREQGIIPSIDVEPTTVVDDPVYDYDFTDVSNYGPFAEGQAPSKDDEDYGEFIETPSIEIGTPADPEEWGEFHELENGFPEGVLNVPVSSGESFIYNPGDGSITGGPEISFSDEEFVELPGVNVTTDANGNSNIEFSGETLENLEREETLTAEDLQRLRDEIAAQYGGEAVTQEEVDELNEEYHRGR